MLGRDPAPLVKRAVALSLGSIYAIVIFIAFATVLAFAGEWTYRNFVRPIDPLPPEVLALAKHFDQSGIKVRPYAVRHGLRHSQVLAAAAFEIAGFPLSVGILLCPTEQSAIERFEAVKRNPNLLPARNDRLVMYLGMWGDDTVDMVAKVEKSVRFVGSGALPRKAN